MATLEWRTYRTAASAPVPVVENERAWYELTQKTTHPDIMIDVGRYEHAEAVRSGQEFGPGRKLPSDVLANDIVLIDDGTPTGTSKRIAEPLDPPNVPSSYRTPRMVAPDEVMIPGVRRPGKRIWRTFTASPVGEGLFTVAPGYVGPISTNLQGEDTRLRVSYSPVSGALYVENEDHEPLPQDAELHVSVFERETLRQTLTGRRDPIVDASTGDVLAVAEKQSSAAEDVRRLPEFDAVTRWHALDQAHYDASPIARDNLYIIQSDAPTNLIRDAVRRTLPAGSIWRTEPFSEDEPGQEPPPEALILDKVTGAVAAYSLKQIASWHESAVAQMRRGSIGGSEIEYRDFLPEEIEDGTLRDWAAAADGEAYVARLYDQSGNNHPAEAPALEEQPLVVQNGSVLRRNGHAFFYQVNDGGLTVGLDDGIDDYTAAVTGGAADRREDLSLYEIDTVDTTAARRMLQMNGDGAWRYAESKFMANNITYTDPDTLGMHNHIITHAADRAEITFDGRTVSVDVPDPALSTRVRLLNDANARSHKGQMQEFILYPRDVSASDRDRLSVHAEQTYSL